MKSLSEILRHHAEIQPDKAAYIYLSSDGKETDSIGFYQLFEKATIAANKIASLTDEGDRVLLAYPTCVEFMVNFLACLLSRRIAVPVPMPKVNRWNGKIQAILENSGARAVLTSAEKLEDIRRIGRADRWPEDVRVACSESMTEMKMFRDAPPGEDEIAFLQYTSGSTSAPKGVEIRHGHIVRNLEMLKVAFEVEPKSVFGTWLPQFHDMGLIGLLLQPFFNGCTCVVMAPTTFVGRPIEWLRMISRYGVTISGGPNFAYDLCVTKIGAEEAANLSLGSWAVAFNGAEPVHFDSLTAFAEKFGKAGFRFESLYPCYGMAEACVFVSGGRRSLPPTRMALDKAAYGRGLVETTADDAGSVQLVNCGRTFLNSRIAILDRAAGKRVTFLTMGEICLSGDQVTTGYWNNPEENARLFVDIDGTPFLRTGDLGFLDGQGDLYVTGRVKDLIIVNGMNYYPQDIEHTVASACGHVNSNHIGVFSYSAEHTERIVVVLELTRVGIKASHGDDTFHLRMARAMGDAVAEDIGINIEEFLFLKPGALPMTSSGKISRQETRRLYLSGNLELGAAVVRRSEYLASSGTCARAAARNGRPAEDRYLALLTESVSRLTDLSASEVDLRRSLFHHGIDSIRIVDLQEAMEKSLGITIPTEVFFASGDIQSLAESIKAIAENRVEHPLAVFNLDEIVRENEGWCREHVRLDRLPVFYLPVSRSPRRILLTGAGGEVGTFLLHEMLLKTDAEIVCLVRSINENGGLNKILRTAALYSLKIDTERVFPLIGDVSRPMLGLSTERYEKLAREIDSVYHCAAIDNFYLPYSSLEATNVGSVKQVIQFALHTRLKPVFYTSSCAVSLIEDRQMDSRQSIGLCNGYAKSKYVAEYLLARAYSIGLPGINFRFGYLFADKSNVSHPEEAFESLITTMLNLGVAPEMSAYFDLTPVEYAVECMIDYALSAGNGTKSSYTLYNPHPLKWSDLIDVLLEFEPTLRTIPLADFKERFHEYTIKSEKKHLKFLTRIVTDQLGHQMNLMFKDPANDVNPKFLDHCGPCDKDFIRRFLGNLLEDLKKYEERIVSMGQAEKFF